MRIFLSYSHDDKPVVRRFADGLRSRGFEVFLDDQNIPPGASISAAVMNNISSADAVVFFLSKVSIGSAWLNHELGIAVSARYSAKQTRIIPVILDKGIELPIFLRDYMWLDLSTSEPKAGISSAIDLLAITLRKLEPKGEPEAELLWRQESIDLERRILRAKELQHAELMKHRARQLFFLTAIASMFAITVVALFLLSQFVEIPLEKAWWLISTILGASSAMLGSYFYLKKQDPAKRELDSLLADIELRAAKLGARDE